MQVFKNGLALMIFGLTASSMVQAATVTIPVQSGMIVDPVDTSCGVTTTGVSSPVTCDAHIPITLPSGSRIQQIGLIYGMSGSYAGSLVSATLWSIDFLNSSVTQTANFSSTQGPAIGSFAVGPMMTQVGKTYPDAFNVQPNTLYYVDVYADRGFIISGLQVTYQ